MVLSIPYWTAVNNYIYRVPTRTACVHSHCRQSPVFIVTFTQNKHHWQVSDGESHWNWLWSEAIEIQWNALALTPVHTLIHPHHSSLTIAPSISRLWNDRDVIRYESVHSWVTMPTYGFGPTATFWLWAVLQQRAQEYVISTAPDSSMHGHILPCHVGLKNDIN